MNVLQNQEGGEGSEKYSWGTQTRIQFMNKKYSNECLRSENTVEKYRWKIQFMKYKNTAMNEWGGEWSKVFEVNNNLRFNFSLYRSSIQLLK